MTRLFYYLNSQHVEVFYHTEHLAVDEVIVYVKE
jgi:hypothetical protein